jgi:hypothetical protein
MDPQSVQVTELDEVLCEREAYTVNNFKKKIDKY